MKVGMMLEGGKVVMVHEGKTQVLSMYLPIDKT